LVVEVRDFDEAVVFYRDVLGLTQEAAFEGAGGARVAILDAGRATLELANSAQVAMIDQIEVGRRCSSKFRVAFEVDDTAGAVRVLSDGGAEVMAEPTETPWRSLNARLEAPGDVQLTLFQELESLEERATRSGFR
jgi:catechol 2,3-dioxygenase-like lactoylglutathione lyase family enzyme